MLSAPRNFKNFNFRWIVALTVVSVGWVHLNQARWKSDNVIVHDVLNYYSYLPAFFYEHDLSMSFLSDKVNKSVEATRYFPNVTPEGRRVIKTSMGMAITYLPFFGLAHVFCEVFNFPMDGYSAPYQMMVLLSTLFYYVIGLFFLNRLLRRFYPAPIVNLTLCCLTFATNVFFYLCLAVGLSHVIGFAFVSMFLYYTVKWYEKPDLRTAMLIGCIGGFLVLVRPINGLIFIFFALYNLSSPKQIWEKITWLTTHASHLFVIAVCAFLTFLPQLCYWKFSTGWFVFNSYVGEHFYFSNPHVLLGLFGFRKGWLVYTPIMSFSLIGLIQLRKNFPQFFSAILILFLIYVYVAFSWWCWWYGGSFGQRVLIDIYPLLAFPFASFVLYLRVMSTVKKRFFYFVFFVLFLLNLFQTVQAKYNIIHFDSMTFENYREVFFTIAKKPDCEKFLKHPDYNRAQQGLDEE